MAQKVITDGHPDGVCIGASSAAKIGFYGKTAITLRSLPASIGAAATTATMKAAINKLRNLVKDLGLGTV